MHVAKEGTRIAFLPVIVYCMTQTVIHLLQMRRFCVYITPTSAKYAHSRKVMKRDVRARGSWKEQEKQRGK